MWAVFVGTVVSPRAAFAALEHDPRAARHGALVLLWVCGVYTAILGAFIASGYPAARLSVLGLPAER